MDDERLGFDGRFRLHPVAFNPWDNYCGRGVVCSFAAASGWQAAADALRQAGIETYVRAKLFYLKRKRMGIKGPPKSEWNRSPTKNYTTCYLSILPGLCGRSVMIVVDRITGPFLHQSLLVLWVWSSEFRTTCSTIGPRHSRPREPARANVNSASCDTMVKTARATNL